MTESKAPYYPPAYAGLKRLGKVLLGVVVFVGVSWVVWWTMLPSLAPTNRRESKFLLVTRFEERCSCYL